MLPTVARWHCTLSNSWKNSIHTPPEVLLRCLLPCLRCCQLGPSYLSTPGSSPIAILILSSSFSKHTRAYSLLRLPAPLAGPCWTLSVASSWSWTSKMPRAFLERGLLVPRQLSQETAHHRVLAGLY